MFTIQIKVFILFPTLCWSFVTIGRYNVIQSTDLGEIRGFLQKTRLGNHSQQFLGVPFAIPPVGDMRFMVNLYH